MHQSTINNEDRVLSVEANCLKQPVAMHNVLTIRECTYMESRAMRCEWKCKHIHCPSNLYNNLASWCEAFAAPNSAS